MRCASHQRQRQGLAQLPQRGGERLQRQQRQVQGDPEHGTGRRRFTAGAAPLRAEADEPWSRCSVDARPPARARGRWLRRAEPRGLGARAPQRDSTGGSASCSGCASGGPRRLSRRSASSSGPALCSARRSGAALGCGAGRRCRAARRPGRRAPAPPVAAGAALGAQPRRQPGQHRADMAALQRLLQRPQRWRWEQVGAAPCAPSRPCTTTSCCGIEAQLRQRPGRQRGRRVEQHHAARRRRLHAACGQAGRQQAHLADAGVRQQQFGQHPARPAAAGQLRVEQLGKAAGHSGRRARGRAGGRATARDAGLHVGSQRVQPRASGSI